MSGTNKQQPQQLPSSCVMVCTRTDSSMDRQISADDSPKFFGQQPWGREPGSPGQYLHHQQQQQQQHAAQLEKLQTCTTDSEHGSPVGYADSNWSIASFPPGQEQHLVKSTAGQNRRSGSNAEGRSSSFAAAIQQQVKDNQTGQCMYRNTDTVDSMAGWAEQHQQQLQEHSKPPVCQEAGKHAAAAIKQFAADLDAAGLPNLHIRELAGQNSSAFDHPDTPKHIGVVSGQVNSVRQVGNCSVRHNATGRRTEPKLQPTGTPSSAVSDVPEALAALLAIVKDEWEWASVPGGGMHVASDAAAQPLWPDSPGAILEVKEGAAAMRDHTDFTYPSSTESTSSPAGQLRALYGRDSSRPASPTRSPVQQSSNSKSSRTSPTRGSLLHATTSSSSSSNIIRTTTTYACRTSSYGTPTRSHSSATSYSRYSSPPRSTGQLNRSSSANMRRSISPSKTAAGFGSSSSTSRTVSPSRTSMTYSTRRTGSPSRCTPACSTGHCRRSSSPYRNPSPTQGAQVVVQMPAAAASAAALLPSATAAVACGVSKSTGGQRSLQQLPRVAELCATAYECVVPKLMDGSTGTSKGGNRGSGGRINEGAFRSSSGKGWRSSEVQQISLGGYAHAQAASRQVVQAAPQLIFVPEHQVEASELDATTCLGNCESAQQLQSKCAVQHQDTHRISNRSVNGNVNVEASLSGTQAAAAVPACAEPSTLDMRDLEQQKQRQAAFAAAATFAFQLPPPIRTRSNPSDTVSAAAQPATSSFSAAGRASAELPRISAGGDAASAAPAPADGNPKRQTAQQQQQQSVRRADSFNSTMSSFTKTNNTSNSSSSSVSAGGLAKSSKAADSRQHANMAQQQQDQQESDSETSVLNPLFSNSNTPKNMSCSGSVPGTGSTGSGTDPPPGCTSKSCSTGGADQPELRHRLSQSTAAAAVAAAVVAESGLIKQEASASSTGALGWDNEVNRGMQGKELTSVAAYLAGGNMRVFDTAFCKGPNTASFKVSAARGSPKHHESGITWVQRLTGSRPARDSTSSQSSHQTNVSNVSNNTVRTSGGSSTGSKAILGSGNGSAAGSGAGSRSSCADSHSRVSIASSAGQGFPGGLKDRPRRSTGGGAKYKHRMLIVLPLLMLLAALGVGAWAWVSVITAESSAHAAAAAGAAAVGPALFFRVVVTVPSVAATQGCGRWFDSSQRIKDYHHLISSAYSKTLNLLLPENPVLNITCGGSAVKGVSLATPGSESAPLQQSSKAARASATTHVGSAAPAAVPASPNVLQKGMYASRLPSKDTGAGRMLLQQFFKTYPAAFDVETVFAVPDKFSTAKQRADLVEKVVSASSEALDQPLQQFFSVSAVMVKAVELLSAEVRDLDPRAAAGDAAGALTLSSLKSASDINSTQAAAAAAAPGASVQQPTALSEPYNNSSSVGLKLEQEQGNQSRTGGIHQFANYQSAPACTFQPTQTNSAADPQGRLWGWLHMAECVFRAPPLGAAAVASKPKKVDWETAALCDDVPNEHNSVIDDSGRLWGWQTGASCAFRLYGKGAKPATPGTAALKAPAASFKDLQNHLPSRVSSVWESAPPCAFAPTDTNVVPDMFGRLWGWENNGSCAFRWQAVPN